MTKLERIGMGTGWFLGVLLSSQAVCAEEATPVPQGDAAPSPAPSAPPAAAPARPESAQDIVRLKSGGIVRGSISELDPKGLVVIVTLTGAIREIPMSEVTYAGPIAKDPKAAPPASAPAASEPVNSRHESVKPYVTVRANEARLHLISTPDGLTFHRQSSSAVAVGLRGRAIARGYDRLCTAPCDITIPSGTETLALSEKDSDAPIAAEPFHFPSGDSTVTGKLDSNASIRVAGWVTMVAGGVVGLALIFTSMKDEEICDDFGCREFPNLDATQMIVGTGLATVSFGVGFYLTRIPDSASIELGGGHDETSIRRLPRASGVALHGRF